MNELYKIIEFLEPEVAQTLKNNCDKNEIRGDEKLILEQYIVQIIGMTSLLNMLKNNAIEIRGMEQLEDGRFVPQVELVAK